MTRALIVDDHPENLYLLRAILEAHGFAVDEARHGAEALTRARLQLPDIVVSDLLMPVLDGYTLLRHWRADDRLKRIPFVVYTATYTEPRDERLAMTLGADAFLVKPAEPDVIIGVVRDVLGKKDRGELPSGAETSLEERELLEEYNEVLVRKLEKKDLEADRVNRDLRSEIAERRRTEEKLRDSEERFRATFEQAAVGIAHVGADGRFLRVNDRLCQMTGFTRDELQAMTFVDLTVPDDRPEGDEARREMLAETRTDFSAEQRYRRKGGGELWGNIHTTLVRDEHGAPAYFITVIIDITDRKTLEEQLRQSQKMEAVGRLAGGVAHDFNNLLTIVSGHSEMLLARGTLAPADRESIEAVREAGERASALTRQLLSFSRQMVMQPQVLDLNTSVEASGKLLRRLIGEDVVLTTVLSPGIGRVKVDPSQLDQVLMNLAVNARDAMPEGGRLTIETKSIVLTEGYVTSHLDCKTGPHAMLSITDTGIGIPLEILPRIFEPFFTTKDVGKGTGLGLPVVFGIIQQSQGGIHVYSEPGKGTTVRIYLPVVAGELTAAVEAAPNVDVRGNETVLIVEDEPGVRRLALMSLKPHGYDVITATDGHDALRVAEAQGHPIDLVLTDVVMPGLSGPELAEGLRLRFPHVGILFMSGYAEDAVVRHGLLEAGVAFIQKPYTPIELARKVRQVLDDRRACG
jgi:PAS domain S-box-containing protein